MATITEKLELAIRYHQAGQLECAEQLYREIVRLDPAHADALHLLGIASHQRNENETAVEYISRAIAVDGSAAIYHSNLGAAYQALGETDEAIDCFHEALRIAPNYADAWHNLAAVLRSAGRLEESADGYRELVRISGGDAWHRVLLGTVLRELGRFESAAQQFRLSIETEPDLADAHFGLGLACRALNQLEQAMECFEAVLRLEPRHSRAHNNLGSALQDRGEVQRAMDCYSQALAIDPNYADAHCNLGTALRALGKSAEAIESYRRAIEVRPDFPDAWFNLGNVYRDDDRLVDAANCYQRTLASSPSHIKAQVNLAVTLKDSRLLDDALECNESALNAHPELPEARFNRSLIWLLRGDFERGWDEYEWRWRHDPQPRRFSLPEWDGLRRAGRVVLVTAEQGLGDEIMFASCVDDLTRTGIRCVVECDRRLVPLFSRSFPEVKFVVRGEVRDNAASLRDVDCQVPCGSLPRWFRRRMSQFPKSRAYLVPDRDEWERWSSRVNALGHGLKVGISWFGGKDEETRRRRSAPLACWRRVFDTTGVQFVNLQYGDVRNTLAEVQREFGVTIHTWSDSDALRGIDSFAALVASLDLVISVDNATVHLAGAVGTPVWTLLPFASDWRWLLDRDDSPWYPSMRLFRQRELGNWSELFDRVAARLASGAAGPRTQLRVVG